MPFPYIFHLCATKGVVHHCLSHRGKTFFFFLLSFTLIMIMAKYLFQHLYSTDISCSAHSMLSDYLPIFLSDRWFSPLWNLKSFNSFGWSFSIDIFQFFIAIYQILDQVFLGTLNHHNVLVCTLYYPSVAMALGFTKYTRPVFYGMDFHF